MGLWILCVANKSHTAKKNIVFSVVPTFGIRFFHTGYICTDLEGAKNMLWGSSNSA
jgi:hypothetical protein